MQLVVLLTVSQKIDPFFSCEASWHAIIVKLFVCQ